MRTEGGQELGLMLTMVHLNLVLRLTFLLCIQELALNLRCKK
jgi:hypothetical protein